MRTRLVIGLLLLLMSVADSAQCGMPALLPSRWTAERGPASNGSDGSMVTHWQLQTLSFFVVAFLVGTKCLQVIWNGARGDFPFLPRLSYHRALSLSLLWGCLFMVVLTMISGARELMTPGAWRKSGWTYQLEKEAESNACATSSRQSTNGHSP